MATFETVATVVSQAARELGLVSAAIANPYASVDTNILQLCSLLSSAGREIVRERRWTQSLKEHTFVTVTGTPTYNFPADWLRMIPQTGWNRTQQLPVGGPVSSEEWQYLKAQLVGVTFNVILRSWQRKFFVFPDTAVPNGHTIAAEYMSSYWVAVTAAPTVGTKDAPTLASDVLLFDTHLMSRALKYHFKKEKGFDASSAYADYQKALEQVMDDDAAPRAHYLGRAQPQSPLLGQHNIPYTGFGS